MSLESLDHLHINFTSRLLCWSDQLEHFYCNWLSTSQYLPSLFNVQFSMLTWVRWNVLVSYGQIPFLSTTIPYPNKICFSQNTWRGCVVRITTPYNHHVTWTRIRLHVHVFFSFCLWNPHTMLFISLCHSRCHAIGANLIFHG